MAPLFSKDEAQLPFIHSVHWEEKNKQIRSILAEALRDHPSSPQIQFPFYPSDFLGTDKTSVSVHDYTDSTFTNFMGHEESLSLCKNLLKLVLTTL